MIEIFFEIDVNQNGVITKRELCDYLNKRDFIDTDIEVWYWQTSTFNWWMYLLIAFLGYLSTMWRWNYIWTILHETGWGCRISVSHIWYIWQIITTQFQSVIILNIMMTISISSHRKWITFIENGLSQTLFDEPR